MVLRPCLGIPDRPCPRNELVRDGNRCPACRPTTAGRGLGSAYQRLARQVIAEESVCWRCGSADVHARRPGDVWTADHVIPRSRGGRLTRSNLRKAHRSCNSGRVEEEKRRGG